MYEKSGSDREAFLLDIGFTPDVGSTYGIISQQIAQGENSLAFSGYGEFTPITVGSETVLKDAYVE